MKLILTILAFALALAGGCSSNDDDKYPVFTFIPEVGAQVMSDEMSQRRENLSASWSGRHDISKTAGVYTYREGRAQIERRPGGSLVVKGSLPPPKRASQKSFWQKTYDSFLRQQQERWRRGMRGPEQDARNVDRWGRTVTIDRNGQWEAHGSPPNGTRGN